MNLRKLKSKDAPLMLEWMHDLSVVQFLRTDFISKTLEDCKLFIEKSQTDSKNLHMAVIDAQDVYMGTVSLKNIHDGMAEFAIIMRKTAMGQGYARYGMNEMLRIGMERMRLNFIYWCVAPENRRAVRFYDKHGYSRICMPQSDNRMYVRGGYSEEQIQKYLWYRA